MPVTKKKTKSQLTKPVWNLYEHGMTQGSISLFLQCREQFRLSYMEGWTYASLSTPLIWGSAFHDILAKVHDGETLSKAVEEHRKAQWHKILPTEREELLKGLEDIQFLIARYLEHWSDEDKGIIWKAREKTFSTPYALHADDGDGVMTDYGYVPIRGRWDGVRKHKDGRLWLHETKTKAQIDEQGLQQSLHLDLQTMLYCWAIREAFGEPPAGIIYDVIRRPSLRSKKLDVDFAERPEHYFKRWPVVLGKKDLDNWEQQFLTPTIRQVVEWYNAMLIPNQYRWRDNPFTNPYHWMNPNALFTRFGRCGLFNIITAKDYSSHKIREVPFPELEDE